MEPILHIICRFLVGLHHGLSVFGRGMGSRTFQSPASNELQEYNFSSLQRRVLMGLA